MTILDVIDKYFEGERCKFFHSSDAHHNIEGDTFLTYVLKGDKVELYMGGDNGQLCLAVTGNPQKLTTLIEAIIR